MMTVRAAASATARLLLLPMLVDLRAAADFTDVARRAGVGGYLDYLPQHQPPTASVPNGWGVFWGDFDSDGFVDLMVTNERRGNRLFRNLRDGNFSDVSDGSSVKANQLCHEYGCHGAAWADYDRDGRLDLYVSTGTSNRGLFHNQMNESAGDVSFRDVSLIAGIADGGDAQQAAAWGDFDGDGLLDLYVTVRAQPCDDSDTPARQPLSDDPRACRSAQRGNLLYRNDGGSHFREVAAAHGVADVGDGVGASWADVDNDGDLDLIVTNRNQPNALYRNDKGNFTNIARAAGVDDAGDGNGAAWGDFNNDGFVDLYVYNARAPNALYVNVGNASFRNVTDLAGVGESARNSTGASWADFNGDGKLDLFVANHGAPNSLYRNDGDFSFYELAGRVGLDDVAGARGCAWADFDADGDLDLFVANDDDYNRLYLNDPPPKPYHGLATLHIVPRSAAGAATLVGATVELQREWGSSIKAWSTNVVGSRLMDGGGGLSQNGYGAHFGGLLASHKYAVLVRGPGIATTRVWHMTGAGGSFETLDLAVATTDARPSSVPTTTFAPSSAPTPADATRPAPTAGESSGTSRQVVYLCALGALALAGLIASGCVVLRRRRTTSGATHDLGVGLLAEHLENHRYELVRPSEADDELIWTIAFSGPYMEARHLPAADRGRHNYLI